MSQVALLDNIPQAITFDANVPAFIPDGVIDVDYNIITAAPDAIDANGVAWWREEGETMVDRLSVAYSGRVNSGAQIKPRSQCVSKLSLVKAFPVSVDGVEQLIPIAVELKMSSVAGHGKIQRKSMLLAILGVVKQLQYDIAKCRPIY